MFKSSTSHLTLLPVITFFLAVAFTEVARRVATVLKFVSKVKKDRWNPRVVPMGGGIAIDIALLTGLFLLDFRLFVELGPPLVLLAVLGIVDDLYELSPRSKLSGQAFAALYVVVNGYCFSPESGLLASVISILWILYVTNAVNLSDNMDGLASGIATICGLFLAVVFAQSRLKHSFTMLSLLLSAAALGFWTHNRFPARIFMGDIGSLPIGFLIATLGLKVQAQFSSPIEGTLISLMLVLVPAFDAIFVMSLRALAGRNIMTGNVDHLSHRLVRAGFTDKSAVAFLHGLALCGGVGAMVAAREGTALALAILLPMVAILGGFLVREEIRSPIAAPISWRAPMRKVFVKISPLLRSLSPNFPRLPTLELHHPKD